jgi:hypothetical protein
VKWKKKSVLPMPLERSSLEDGYVRDPDRLGMNRRVVPLPLRQDYFAGAGKQGDAAP